MFSMCTCATIVTQSPGFALAKGLTGSFVLRPSSFVPVSAGLSPVFGSAGFSSFFSSGLSPSFFWSCARRIAAGRPRARRRAAVAASLRERMSVSFQVLLVVLRGIGRRIRLLVVGLGRVRLLDRVVHVLRRLAPV